MTNTVIDHEATATDWLTQSGVTTARVAPLTTREALDGGTDIHLRPTGGPRALIRAIAALAENPANTVTATRWHHNATMYITLIVATEVHGKRARVHATLSLRQDLDEFKLISSFVPHTFNQSVPVAVALLRILANPEISTIAPGDGGMPTLHVASVPVGSNR